MLASDIPVKIDEAWATNATMSFIRTIPDTTTDPNAASFSLGFPPNTFLDEAAGGEPPDGRDFNGILQQITQWTRWLNAGAPVQYDAAFSATVGGYPAGAWLLSTGSVNAWWVSQVDNNTTNPDTGGANWLPISFGNAGSGSPVGAFAGNAPQAGSVAQSFYYDLTGGTGLWICTATGTSSTATWAQVGAGGGSYFFCGTSAGAANAQSVTTPSSMTVLTAGMLISMTVGAGLTTTGAATLALNPATGPSFGSFPIRRDSITGPVALVKGEIVAANRAVFLFDGAALHLLNPASGTAAQANASSATGIVIAASGSFTTGHLIVAADTAGTGVDGGPPPTSSGAVVISTSGTYSPGTYFCDTSGGVFTVTLSATLAGVYTFVDAKNTWSANPVTINGNGTNIGNVPGNVASTFLANVSDYQFSIEAAGTYWRLV